MSVSSKKIAEIGKKVAEEFAAKFTTQYQNVVEIAPSWTRGCFVLYGGLTWAQMIRPTPDQVVDQSLLPSGAVFYQAWDPIITDWSQLQYHMQFPMTAVAGYKGPVRMTFNVTRGAGTDNNFEARMTINPTYYSTTVPFVCFPEHIQGAEYSEYFLVEATGVQTVLFPYVEIPAGTWNLTMSAHRIYTEESPGNVPNSGWGAIGQAAFVPRIVIDLDEDVGKGNVLFGSFPL